MPIHLDEILFDLEIQIYDEINNLYPKNDYTVANMNNFYIKMDQLVELIIHHDSNNVEYHPIIQNILSSMPVVVRAHHILQSNIQMIEILTRYGWDESIWKLLSRLTSSRKTELLKYLPEHIKQAVIIML